MLGLLLTSCAGTPWLERQCFESLSAEYVAAQEELLELDTAGRAGGRDRPASGNKAGVVEDQVPRQRIEEAQARRAAVLLWYERLYDRLRLRAEEEEMLAELRLLLFMGPTALFYPVVRWNLHEVLWDGTDPDADSDPVIRYCTERLAGTAEQVHAEATGEWGPVRSP